MAQVYLITGKLGSGKTLATVGKIRDYLADGRMIATNLDLNLENFGNPWSKSTRVYRLPDKPVVDDLENLPPPYEGEYDEKKTGLLVLDECGTWLNTRGFNYKTRQPVINKLLHIRKAGWDVMFIIQHIEMVDKQIREGLGEQIVTCRRADRLSIPIVTPLTSFMGVPVRPPKLHVAEVKYGSHVNAPRIDRWVYLGKELYDCYDTRQVFGANDCGLHCVLPPYFTHGINITRNEYAKKQLKKAYIEKLTFIGNAKRFFFLFGIVLGWALMPNDISFSITDLIFDQPAAQVVKQESETEIKEQDTETKETDIQKGNRIWITAAILKDNGYEYIFKQNGETYYPQSDGYTVRWINHCKAKLDGINESKTVSCGAPTASIPVRG